MGVLDRDDWHRENELSYLVGVLDREDWHRTNEMSYLVGVAGRSPEGPELPVNEEKMVEQYCQYFGTTKKSSRM